MHRVHPRTRTGCLPCRRRKKKYDEAKPQCRACTRNKLQCAWPPHIVRIVGLDAEQTQGLDDLHTREGFGSPIDVRSRVNTPPPIPPASSTTQDPNATSEDAERQTSERKNHRILTSLHLKNSISAIRAGMLLPESPMLLSHYLGRYSPQTSASLTVQVRRDENVTNMGLQ